MVRVISSRIELVRVRIVEVEIARFPKPLVAGRGVDRAVLLSPADAIAYVNGHVRRRKAIAGDADLLDRGIAIKALADCGCDNPDS